MEITAGFCILWALMILVLPVDVLLAAAGAAAVHELCHALAVRLTGGQVLGLTLRAGGLTMEVSPMPPGRELLCALAGPAGSLLLAMLPVPKLALCALIQGMFNLLPLEGLDGGRILGCILEMTIPIHQEWLMQAVQWLTLGILLGLILWLKLGVGAVGFWMVLAMRKFPCKQGRKAVQ